ncbi:MAG: tRNA 2-thiouridine(34) synthase MnmA [Clostridia bacterium]|nr:tRNA 2-thiouridine(34) synthase MnmA [Clostridia bacterium]
MRILLGLSGGLDSVSAARILMDAGHTVEGAVLLMTDHSSPAEAGTAAREVGIPLHVIDCRERFSQIVIADFLAEYRRGRTPSPCTVCNRNVKMDTLYRYATDNGFDGYATGHYCRIEQGDNGRFAPTLAADRRKDQTYMLWRMTQEQLSMLHTPLSDRLKSDLRAEAAALGLTAASAGESQDTCFIPEGMTCRDYLAAHIGEDLSGNFVDADGKVLGKHQGIQYYTVGQRKGLGIALGKPAFVTKIDPAEHTVTLQFAEDTFARRITLTDLNFVGDAPRTEGELRRAVKIRYAAPPVPATIRFDGETATVEFDPPVRTPAPGQSAVFYDGDRLAFGGVIDEVFYE